MGTNDKSNTKEIKSKPDFYSVVAIQDNKVSNITGGYIYIPRTHFGGGTVKWFDDSRLAKGGAV